MAPAARPIFDPARRRDVAAAMQAHDAYQRLGETRPSRVFAPHENGQLQALRSDHIYRILIPGNGWGKTTCMAADADLLMQRADPFKAQVMPEPDRPTNAVWFCEKYQQWEIMRPDVEAMLTKPFKWRGDKNFYAWPNGSRLFVLSSDSDWTAIQGVQLDAVYFDEHPDRKFWVEMQFRRRGKYKTRYMVAATMTQGLTWFVKQVIQPWEDAMRELGLTQHEAMDRQPHDRIFMWPSGGILDNPIMGDDDARHYASVEGASEKELEVRTKGGYADFTGMPVFHLPSLQRMAPAAGESGAIVFIPDEDEQARERLTTEAWAAGSAELGHRFAIADVNPEFFRWVPGMEIEGGRVTMFEPPDPDEAGNYLIGADFAAGLAGMDYDAALVGRKTADGQVVQVAEAHGHWGDVFFAEILYALGALYFEAFICGERQFGLPTLRRLYDEMGYVYMFHQRREQQRARRFSDLLGHHRGPGDTIIPNHRLAIRREDVILASAEAIQEHKRYQFKPRRKEDVIDDIERSEDLTTGAPSGEHDDLVMGGAYLTHAAREIVHYPRPKRAYRPGTFGAVMDLEQDLHPERQRGRQDPYGLPKR